MARDSGNTLRSARSLNLTTGPKTRSETIGGVNDARDFFKFNLTSRSSFELRLGKLRSNVDVLLLNSAGKAIGASRQMRRRSESIRKPLNAGTYYIRLDARAGTTGYELRVAATPIPPDDIPDSGNANGSTNGASGGLLANTAPAIATNLALAVNRQGTATIGRANLFSSDTQQTGDQLLYRLTSLPAAGTLLLNGTPLGVGSAFTQTDIDNNRLTYQQNSIKSIPNSGPIELTLSPKISGSNIVWAAKDSTGDTEIFLYRGSTGTVTQLSDNSVDDFDPQISGANVVWQSGEDDAAEIYLYSGTTGTTTRLTDNSGEDSQAKISDSYVVWQRKDSAANYDIRYYRLGDPPTATSTVNNSISYADTNPVISGSKIAFRRNDSAAGSTLDGIYYFDLAAAGSETQLTPGSATDDWTDRRPQISGSTVVWEREYSSGNQDVLYDTNPLAVGFQSIDSSIVGDERPLISGSNIVFNRAGTPGGTQDGGYLFNTSTGTLTRFITPSSAYFSESIDGNLVGWTETGSSATAHLYNIATGTTLLLNGGVAVQGLVAVSGGNATWIGGNSFSTIDRLFFYDSSIVTDSFGFSVSHGVLATNGTFNFTIG